MSGPDLAGQEVDANTGILNKQRKVYVYLYLFIFLLIYLSIYLSNYLFIYLLSTYLSIFYIFDAQCHAMPDVRGSSIYLSMVEMMHEQRPEHLLLCFHSINQSKILTICFSIYHCYSLSIHLLFHLSIYLCSWPS